MVRASRDVGGSVRLDDVRSTPLVTLRRAAGSVYMVGGAATPLGGDHASLALDVDDGAILRIRSVAAAVARPGPHGAPARFTVRARVGRDAMLRWEPEPGVAAAGCDVTTEAYIDLAPGARLWWRDELVLGRCAEAPGRWSSYLHVDRDALPLLRHHVVLGGSTADGCGPAIAGSRRAVASLLTVGAAHRPRVVHHAQGHAAVLPLAGGDAALVSAMAVNHPALRVVLDDAAGPAPVG
jgi:urease accessory protein